MNLKGLLETKITVLNIGLRHDLEFYETSLESYEIKCSVNSSSFYVRIGLVAAFCIKHKRIDK